MDQYNYKYCPHRLPCGMCKETGSWCFYANGTEITCNPNAPYIPPTAVPITTPNLEIRYTTSTEE